MNTPTTTQSSIESEYNQRQLELALDILRELRDNQDKSTKTREHAGRAVLAISIVLIMEFVA